MGIRFLENTEPKIRFLPPPFDIEEEVEGIGIGTAIASVPTGIPGVGISTQVDGLDFIPIGKPKVKFIFDTPETMISEPAPDVDEAIAKTFIPDVTALGVLPLGEATAFMDIAEPTTGLADDPFRNLRTIMNLGFMGSLTTIPFAVLSLARASVEGEEQPILGHLGQLSEPTKFDTHEVLMSEVHTDTPLFSKILGDLELLYLVGLGVRSIGEAERLVERSLRTNGRRLDAKTVEEFLEKPLLSATEADVREIISARQATNNRVSGKKFLDELKARGFKEDAERWKRFMINERQAGSEAAQTAKINNDIRGELPEVSKSTMDAAHPVRKAEAPAVVKKVRSEPNVVLSELDLKVFPEEIKGHNSAEFDATEPAFIKAREELVVSVNASGESAASLEALSVEVQRKAKGIKHIVVDSRSGKSRPAIGPRPEDNPLNPHDMLVRIEGGSTEVVNKGKSAIERPGVVEKAASGIVSERPKGKPAPTTEIAPEIIETRGSERRFHGSSSGIVSPLDLHSSTLNIYGDGFYTTDAMDVGIGYSKKGRGTNPTLYEASPTSGGVNLYNLDKPMPNDIKSELDEILSDSFSGDFDGLLSKDFRTVDGEQITNVKELFDEIRAESRELGIPADEIQELFDSIRFGIFEPRGFRGFTHIGGLSVKKFKEHRVDIFWFPESDISISKVLPSEFVEPPSIAPSRVSLEEIKLAETVTEVEGMAPPPVGLSIRKVGKPTPKELGEFKFEDAEIEQRYTNAKGVPKISFAEKVGDNLATLKNRATRTFELLPTGAKYAEIKLLLVRLQKKTIQQDQATRILEGITKKLGEQSSNVFDRKVLADDLSFEAAEGRQIPFGFTPAEVNSELSRLDSIVARSPEIQESIRARHDLWDSLRSETIKEAELAGFNLEGRFNNPSYFRHQVLEYARSKGFADKGTKKPSGSYLKTRGGSQLDINTNYLEAEYEVISNMLHDIEMYKFIAKVRKFDIKPELVKQFGRDDWRKNIPEGQATFQFDDGHFFYHANTIPEKIANKLLIQGLGEIGISADDIGVAMAVGGLKHEIVIPTELAATLKDPFPDAFKIPGERAIKAWKSWAIGSPRRIARFSIRNMTGDTEVVWIGNPRGFAEAPAATKELYQAFFGNMAMSPELREFFKRGAWESTLIAQELQDLNALSNFKHIRDVKTPISQMPKEAWNKYWKLTRNATNFREMILRYANFKAYNKQIAKSPIGAPANFGASVPEEIMGLSDTLDRSYKLANDLLGAYDEITVMGRSIRKHLIPFWSFQELNLRRYYRFIKNIIDDQKTMEMLGRRAIEANVPRGKDMVLIEIEPGTYGFVSKKKQAAILAGKLTARAAAAGARFSAKSVAQAGKFIVGTLALWTLANAWNMTYFPDIEEELPEQVRTRPHIIFGRKKNGDPFYFSRIGVLGDALEWVGLDDFPSKTQAVLSGQQTFREVFIDMIKSPFNKVFGSSRPLVKLMLEVAFRRTAFPDVFEPRSIRDRGFHIARSFGLGNEYVALMRLPSSGYMDSMSDFFAYSSNPGTTAYFGIIDKKNRFMKKTLGKAGEGFFFSPKGNALYNYKLAIRFGDTDAQSRFLTEYVKLSGLTSRKKLGAALKNTINAADPLFGLKTGKGGQVDERLLFVSTLDAEGQRQLVKALHFYEEVIKGKD